MPMWEHLRPRDVFQHVDVFEWQHDLQKYFEQNKSREYICAQMFIRLHSNVLKLNVKRLFVYDVIIGKICI